MDTPAVDRTVEIEKKYRLPASRRESLQAALRECGYEYIREDHEENTIYGGEVLPEGSVVRIRRTQGASWLTFKRRMENAGDVKQQTEIETEVSDAVSADLIVRELGLKPKLIYEKRREIWKLRETEVLIDELPFGDYVEIEGSVTGIREAELMLGIDDLETEHETYPRLTARLGEAIGDVVEARFTSARK
jgi:adenylate cyclase class 2